jgi:hypothetical protein
VVEVRGWKDGGGEKTRMKGERDWEDKTWQLLFFGCLGFEFLNPCEWEVERNGREKMERGKTFFEDQKTQFRRLCELCLKFSGPRKGLPVSRSHRYFHNRENRLFR